MSQPLSIIKQEAFIPMAWKESILMKDVPGFLTSMPNYFLINLQVLSIGKSTVDYKWEWRQENCFLQDFKIIL